MGGDSTRGSLLARAYRRYSKHGLGSLVGSSVRYLSRRALQTQAISTAELEQLVLSRGLLWYGNYEESFSIERPNHDRLRATFGDYRTEFHPNRPFVCEIPDCHLVDPGAMVMYRGRCPLLDTTRHRFSKQYFDSSPRQALHAIKSELGIGPDCTDQLLFPLVCLNPSYYHWLVEFLPKLRLLELYSTETGRRPSLLIEPDPRDFVVETLELAGYGPGDCLTWDHRQRAVQTLVVASHRPHLFDYEHPSRSSYHPSRVDFEWLRNRMRSGLPENEVDADTGRRIYISRQQAGRGRKLINDGEVLAELRSRGFELHVLEEYSFDRQLRLFMEADVVAGPHGAGLANMLFADDPLVVELFPETVLKPHFYFLAKIMGFEYEAVVTDSVNNNLHVDIDHLKQRLDEIGL